MGVGALINRKSEAQILCTDISKQFSDVMLPFLNLQVAYLIWRKPYMVAGQDTFIDSLLQKCGLVNVFKTDRYPVVTSEELMIAEPDIVFLSSEPYPFGQKHIDEFKEILPGARIVLVDGEMFSWYGNRLLYAPAYFKELLDMVT
jgi:ABC-type Fe3+-hydroxamate transport system substrate-binding protein